MFDGVGGHHQDNVDPSFFSWAVAKAVAMFGRRLRDPVDAVKKAVHYLQENFNDIEGNSIR